MDGAELKDLRELVEFLRANDIAEFGVEKGDLKLQLKFSRAETAAAAPAVDLAQLARLMASAPAAAPTPAGAAQATVAAAESATAPVTPAAPAEPAHHILKSPIVGTFYQSSAPGAAPFVKVGDRVEVGQILCIVEAMKLMNEIESDAAGEIVARIAADGQPVEYGQPLFSIKA